MNTTDTHTTTGRPGLTFAHPNARGTGGAVQFALRPARMAEGRRIEGGIHVYLAPQRGEGFDWAHALEFDLRAADIGHVLMVLRGHVESVEDGKGLFCRPAWGVRCLRFAHVIEPCCGYRLDMFERRNAENETRQAGVMLRYPEAIALEGALAASLGRVAFGD